MMNNNNNNEAKNIVASLAIGMIIATLLIMLVNRVPTALLQQAKDAIELCEAELPRDQRCVVSAVVELRVQNSE